jgi:hypothetical protein
MEEKVYQVINIETGEVVNLIVWDGVTPYDPGSGYRLELYIPPDPIVDPDSTPTADPTDPAPQGVTVFE